MVTIPYHATSHIEEQGDPLDDPRAFRRALGQFATGVTVMATMTDDGPVGITVNSFAALSLDPPLISWSIRTESQNREIFARGGHFAVSVLAEDQIDACTIFGRPGFGQFETLPWTAGLQGDPVLDCAIAHFECTVEATFPGGDHEIIIGRVHRYTRFTGTPLLFTQGQYRITADHPQTQGPVEFPRAQGVEDSEPMFVSLLRTTERSIWDRFEEHREQLGLGMVETLIINLLAVRPRSLEQLATGALVGVADVEDSVRALSERGLIALVRGEYGLSYEGRRLRKDLQTKAEAFNERLIGAINSDDMATTRKVLLQLLTF